MKKNAPKELANKLAKLHDLVMEIQDDLSSYEYDDTADEIDDFYDLQEIIDDLETETSKLDCEYNNY